MKNKLFLVLFLLIMQLPIFPHGNEHPTPKKASLEVKKEVVVKSNNNTIIKEIYIEVEKKGTNKTIFILMMLVNFLTLIIAIEEIIKTRKEINMKKI